MAGKLKDAVTGILIKSKKKNPGVHSKKKNSRSKSSKNYNKRSCGQGK